MSKTLDELMTLVATLESEAVYAAVGGGKDGLEGVRTARYEFRNRLTAIVTDAERYKFLSKDATFGDYGCPPGPHWWIRTFPDSQNSGLMFDDVVDAARNQTKDQS